MRSIRLTIYIETRPAHGLLYPFDKAFVLSEGKGAMHY